MRKFAAIVASVLALALLVACGSPAPQGPLKIGVTPWNPIMFAYLAQEKGFFEKNGVKVELINFPVASDQTAAFSAGKIDGAFFSSPDTIVPLSKGVDLKFININDKSVGGDGIVATSAIKSLQDLKGKKVATEFYTIEHFYLLSVLDAAGIDPKDVELINMTIADAGTAFIAGKLDAAALYEPFLSTAVAQGKGTLLTSTKDTPELITDGIAFQGQIVKDRPKDVQAYLQSWYDAIAYWKANPDEANAIMAKHLEISAKDFADTMSVIQMVTPEENLVAFTPAENSASWVYNTKKIAGFLVKAGQVDAVPAIETMVDTTFLKGLKL